MSGFSRDMMGVGFGAAQAVAINGGQPLLGQTATGNSQGTAFAITAAVIEFTTVAASTGAILPYNTQTGLGMRGDAIFVVNNGANSLNVYPPVGFSIGTTAVNGAVAVSAGSAIVFKSKGDGNYWFQGGGSGGGGSGTVTSVGVSSTDLSVSGSPVTTAGNITLNLAAMPATTIKANVTGGSAAPTNATGTQVTAILDTFTSGAKGLAPASGGGTTNYLRADGTWAAPAGGGGGNVSNTGTPTSGQAAEWTNATTIQGVAVTGTGSYVKGTAPTITLANGTGLPISTGVSGLGTGVATFLATPSSANLAAAVTGETGSGALVFGTSPTVSGATLTGITTVSGATLNTPVTTTITANAGVINAAIPLATASNNANTTLTETGSPSAGQFYAQWCVNTDSSARVWTIPSSYSIGRQTTITTFTLPANSRVLLSFYWDGSTRYVQGDTIPIRDIGIPFLFPTGADDTQVVLPFSAAAGSLVKCRTVCDSGTATYQVRINGVAVTATSNSVSSTPQSQTITAANTVAIDDVITIVRTANSSCVNGRGTIYMTPATP